MSDLYLRKVILDIVPETGDSLQIDGLRIKFDIEKTNESTPNNAEIQIYNLSEATRSLLEAKGTKIRLSIGYLGQGNEEEQNLSGIEVAFIGDVSKTVEKTDPPNLITIIEVADGGSRYRNARYSKGYPPNTKLVNIVNDIVSNSGLSNGPIEGIPDKNYANGIAFSGLVRDHLDSLSESNQIEWSIQDEAVQIIPRDKALENVIVELDQDSGLVGSPSKTKAGIEFKALIQARFSPGKSVKLTSRFVDGTFKLRKVRLTGDSQEGDFLAHCEATEQ